jgi:hypothetical protein
MRAKTQAALRNWQSEIERLRPADDQNAMTIKELSKAMARDRMWITRYLEGEMNAGRVKKTSKRVKQGERLITVSAYIRV